MNAHFAKAAALHLSNRSPLTDEQRKAMFAKGGEGGRAASRSPTRPAETREITMPGGRTALEGGSDIRTDAPDTYEQQLAIARARERAARLRHEQDQQDARARQGAAPPRRSSAPEYTLTPPPGTQTQFTQSAAPPPGHVWAYRRNQLGGYSRVAIPRDQAAGLPNRSPGLQLIENAVRVANDPLIPNRPKPGTLSDDQRKAMFASMGRGGGGGGRGGGGKPRGAPAPRPPPSAFRHPSSDLR